MLTTAQLAALKADILADPVLAAADPSTDGADTIAKAYNLAATPDWWVWRTRVSQLEIVSVTTADATAWSWTTYIARSQGERDAWKEMFADTGYVNAALLNVRAGFADIFSGAGGAAQRTHLLAIARRAATRIEKLLSTGTGTTVSPGTMTFEGNISFPDVQSARNS